MEGKGEKNKVNNYKMLFIFLFAEIKQYFCNILKKEEDVSAGIAAIKTLMKIITHYKCVISLFNLYLPLFDWFYCS